MQFLHKNKLKSEIFNDKKVYKQNVFLSHNWEILTRENLIFKGDHEKLRYRGIAQKGRLEQFADFRGGDLTKKRGWCF